jgi:hypothetical protein
VKNYLDYVETNVILETPSQVSLENECNSGKMSFKRSRPKYFRLLVVSILIHATFIALIIFIAPSRNKATINEPEPKSVISYLYSPPKTPKTKISSEPIKPNSSSTKPVTQSNTEQNEAKPSTLLSTKQTNKTSNVTENIRNNAEQIEALPTTIAQEAPKVVITSSSSNKTITVNTDILTQSSTSRNTLQPLQSLVKEHLQSYNDEYSLKRAVEYRLRKTSPIIDSTTAINTLSPSLSRPSITVDCGDMIKRLASGISKLGGGTVNCRNNAQFQQFIDKRLSSSIEKADDETMRNK